MLAAMASFSNQKYLTYTTFLAEKNCVKSESGVVVVLNYKFFILPNCSAATSAHRHGRAGM